MSTLEICPLLPEHLEDYIRLYWAAFQPLEVDMLAPMIYPNGLQPDLMARYKERILRETNGKLGDSCFYARDTQSGEMIAISRWAMIDRPASTLDEVDAAWRRAEEASKVELPVAGANIAMDEAFRRASLYAEYFTVVTIRDRPYMSLRLLATHPDHQRKGAGSLLLRQGLARADELKFPVYLNAAAYGKDLYAKYGFDVVAEFPFDGREYGGRSEGKHWDMLRQARG